MAETTLITKSDIEQFWPSLDKNFKESKINTYILRAQQSKLKELLGEALYHDFVTNIADAKYQQLLNGDEYEYNGYTVFFGGVKPLLSAYTYSMIVAEVSISTGRASVVNKENEQSTPHSNEITQGGSNTAYSEALRLQEEVLRFLDENRSTYDLFGRKETYSQDNSTTWRITRVPRHRQL